MRAYAAAGISESGTLKTALTLIGATTVRPRLFDLTLGSITTPADQAGRHHVQRFTAAGTAGAAVVPEPLDPGDVAAVATSGQTHSVEPTYTAGKVLLQVPLNQRATFRWVASPGAELVGPATAANGLGIKIANASAAMVLDAVAHFYE